MEQPCCDHACEHDATRAADQLERERHTLSGAILLAAMGRYGVIVANFPNARLHAAELGDEAARHGVEIIVEDMGGGRADLRVHHA